MRILVAIAARLDSIAANALNTFKLSDGFARLGHEVTVVCRAPRNRNFTAEDLRKRMALAPTLQFLPTPNLLFGWRLYRDELFGRQAAREAQRLKPDFAYCRAYVAPARIAGLGIPTAAEAHKVSSRARVRKLCEVGARNGAFRTFVTIAAEVADHFVRLGMPRGKVMILQTGVDLSLFGRPPDRPRKPPSAVPNVVYAGHLFDYKGIPTILEAAALMPKAMFTLVGGRPDDIERHAKSIRRLGLSNVRLLGPKSHAELPPMLWDADVLLLPPSAHHVSANITSPVKLGEYLASGSPVVATRIPALERLLTEREACLVAPDDGRALAKGIERILDDQEYADGLGQAGMARAASLGYPARAQAILRHALGLTSTADTYG